MALSSWHVYIGSELGLLKGVDFVRRRFGNINFSQNLSKGDEIWSMSWEDSSQKRIIIGQNNQIVKIYDSESNTFSFSKKLNMGQGVVRGVHSYDGKILAAVDNGVINLGNEDTGQKFEIKIDEKLNKMVPNSFQPQFIGTGGEDSDLKVWDLQNPQVPVFKGKNVKNDYLDLRIPVWINDLKFNTNGTIVTCGRYFQVRLYDPRAQRRPVSEMEFDHVPIMSVSLAHNEHHVVAGSCKGRMGLLDLRRKLLVHCFKGAAGSIRSIQCHPTLPIVASCGLDRFVRIHDLNTSQLISKIYLKSRLNSLLLRDSVPDLTRLEEPKATEKKAITCQLDKEEEKIWNSMKVVEDKKRQTAPESDSKSPKKLKSEEGESD